MNESGLTYTTQNVTTTVSTQNGKTMTLTARDRFAEALDNNITNVQQMKAILTEHVNFLCSFLNRSEESLIKEIEELKAKRGLNIRRKYKENYKSNAWIHDGITEDYTRKIKELEAYLEPAYA